MAHIHHFTAGTPVQFYARRAGGPELLDHDKTQIKKNKLDEAAHEFGDQLSPPRLDPAHLGDAAHEFGDLLSPPRLDPAHLGDAAREFGDILASHLH